MAAKAKWRVFKRQNKQVIENVVHLSTSSQRIVSDDFNNVLNDYLHQNYPNFLGSITGGLTCLDFGYGRAAGVPEPHPIHILG